MNTRTPIAPLTKSATVPCTRERAFEIFTVEMSAWWPVQSHSVGQDPQCRVEIDGRVGGQILETLPDGSTSVWGTITAWDPPTRIAFTWHPGTPVAEATTVEVTFEGSGTETLVTLVHGGWSTRPDGAAARNNYDSGWEFVLDLYRAAAR